MRHGSPEQPFADRRAAGRELAAGLRTYAGRRRLIVLALPRGGVPVGAQVSAELGGALDVLIVRKIGAPGQPELAIGAVAGAAGVRVTVHNAHVLTELGSRAPTAEALARAQARELEELDRRELLYRAGRPPVSLEGRTVLLVDDGLATGASMRAAVTVASRLAPAWLAAAVPVGAAQACTELAPLVDDFVCLRSPEPFRAVGHAYRDFSETTDDEVRRALGLDQ